MAFVKSKSLLYNTFVRANFSLYSFEKMFNTFVSLASRIKLCNAFFDNYGQWPGQYN